MSLVPLAVDLDGTLLCSDMLHESAMTRLREHPFDVVRFPFWLRCGKAYLKDRLAETMDVDPALLPYNKAVLEWLRNEHAQGRTIVLCTATHERLAQKIADYLGLFSLVLASTSTLNLAGEAKATALVTRYGERGFDYMGNGTDDLAVWAHAHKGIAVNATPVLLAQARRVCPVAIVFPSEPPSLRVFLRAMRIHQWLKNTLLFVPAIAAHNIGDPRIWSVLLLAFLAFGACASAVYLVNDLLDLENDRRHVRKRHRPLAAGTMSILQAVLLVPILLIISMFLALMVNHDFFLLLIGYFSLTLLYSLWLKRALLLDCVLLAVLYTVRVIAGGLALQLPISFWLLAFSGFLFISLAFVKRYAELTSLRKTGKKSAPGRAYHVSDMPVIRTFGITAAYTAVLVLALYLNSDAVILLYPQPMWLWLEIPVLTFWVSWLWMQSHRGRMHDDPVMFAIKDTASLASGALFLALLGAAALL